MIKPWEREEERFATTESEVFLAVEIEVDTELACSTEETSADADGVEEGGGDGKNHSAAVCWVYHLLHWLVAVVVRDDGGDGRKLVGEVVDKEVHL